MRLHSAVNLVARPAILATAAAISITSLAVDANAQGVARYSNAQFLAGAGYTVASTKVKSASVVVVVPRITCKAKDDLHVLVGAWGIKVEGRTHSPWVVAALAACRSGKPVYSVVATLDGRRDPMGSAHAGDHVRLTRTGDGFEFVDQTQQFGGGGADSAPDNDVPVLRNVVIGVRTSRSVSTIPTPQILRSNVDGTPLPRTHPARQTQAFAHSVASPSRLAAQGAFSVSTRRTMKS